jgi:hypothetical protein
MPVARCSARRRDGRECGALASSPTATYCRRHEALAAELGDQAVQTGNYPRRRTPRVEMPLVIDVIPTATMEPVLTNGTAISPAEVRPRLAQVTAESVGAIEEALLGAALGATKETWVTFTCPDCGKKHRAQVQVADNRARIDAIEVLLREGLGRPAQAEESPTPPLPRSAEQIQQLGWTDLLALGTALELHEVETALAHGGPEALRVRLRELSADQRRALRQALAEPALA